MTRRELEQCRSLPDEIKSIEAAIRSPKSTTVAVFYKDYRTGKGIPKSRQETDNGEEYVKLLTRLLNNRKKKLRKRLLEAEEFIEGIEDSRMRTILTRHYLEGLKQKDIAKELHYTPTRISQLISAFWIEQSAKDKSKK